MDTNTVNTNTVNTNTVKKIGTREEVYKSVASRTAGGLTKNDIIEKNFNGKLIYISKKISDKMRAQMTALQGHTQTIQQNTQSNTNTQTNTNTLTLQQLQEYNKNKKILKKNKKTLAALKTNNTTNTNTNTNTTITTNNKNLINKHKSKTQKLSFQVNNNEVKNVYYPELKGLDLKELKADLLREEQEEDFPSLENTDNNNNKSKKPLEPFKVDELPDIDINFL